MSDSGATKAEFVEFLRNWRSSTAPICIVCTEQHPICFCITLNIVLIGSTARITVMRVELVPLTCFIPEIDIVPKSLFLAASQIGFLLLELFIFPVFVKCFRFRYTHDINENSLFVSGFASSTDYPVSYSRTVPNFWLTCS